MADLFDGYTSSASKRTGPAAWDEMFSADSEIRRPYREIHDALAQMTQEEGSWQR